MNNKSAFEPPVREGWRRRSGGRAIGVISPSYGIEKVSYALAPTGYEFSKVRSLPLHRLPVRSNYLENTRVIFPTRVNLIHTFNQIVLNGPKFIVSFELEFPRYFGNLCGSQIALAMRALRSDRCAAILGISSIATRQAKTRFENDGEFEIAKKVDLFRGGIPSKSEIDFSRKRNPSGPLRLIFVGNGYLNKGLVACAKAIHSLLCKGANIQFDIVSSLEDSSHIGHKSIVDEKMLMDLFSMEQVSYLGTQPNAKVRELMEASDFLLFPTLDESLGWVPIEAGMAGTATIASRIYAIPELIDSGASGFLLDVPLSEKTGRWEGVGHPDGQRMFHDMQNTLARQLEVVIERCIEDRTLALSMGLKARTKMMSEYAIAKAARQLGDIYSACI